MKIRLNCATLLKILCVSFVALAGCDSTPRVAQPVVASDRCYVAPAALRHMMEKHREGGGYSAYVIDGGEFTSQLIAAFAGHKPKLVADVHQVSTETGPPIDKTTGKVVEEWMVRVVGLEGNRATAHVGYVCGNLCGAWYTLQLVRKDGRWTVESESLVGVS